MQTIGVIGVGKLGLCLALILEKAGFLIRGYDISKPYCEILRKKELKTIEPHLTKYLLEATNFFVDDNIDKIYNLPFIFVVVNTPSLQNGSYDHSAIDSVVNTIVSLNEIQTYPEKKILVISCTTMPTYCDSIQEKLSKYNYDVVYNPEFIAQGDIIKGLTNPDMVLIGGDTESCLILRTLYTTFLENTPSFQCMKRTEAEITKISINCFVTTKISFANVIGDIVHKSGGDPAVVLNAIGSDTRVGNKFLKWGHGFGGPCLPRDNRSLCFYANTLHIKNNIGEVTDISNKDHLINLLELIKMKNNDHKPILIDGVVYKKNTYILEESQQLELANLLVDSGYKVIVCEKLFVIEELKKRFPGKFEYIDQICDKDGWFDLRDLKL